jgi:hypothetical protein
MKLMVRKPIILSVQLESCPKAQREFIQIRSEETD